MAWAGRDKAILPGENAAKRKEKKKEGGLYDKMLWTKFKVELDCKILCSQLWQADFAVLRP